MKKSISSILTTINSTGDFSERFSILRKIYGENIPFRNFVNAVFHPDSKIVFPETNLKFQKILDREGILYKSQRIFYVFSKPWILPEQKTKKIFENLLETLDGADADMLISFSSKERPFENITKEVLEAAFGWRFENVAEPNPLTVDIDEKVDIVLNVSENDDVEKNDVEVSPKHIKVNKKEVVVNKEPSSVIKRGRGRPKKVLNS